MCNCYVQTLSDETRYWLHRGSHDLDCAKWRESLDSVDAQHDAELRDAHHAGTLPRYLYANP